LEPPVRSLRGFLFLGKVILIDKKKYNKGQDASLLVEMGNPNL
jgi:hypothetical protein